MRTEPRFVVTELEGNLTLRFGGSDKTVGASYHVIDTRINHRLCATFRAEENQRHGVGNRGGALTMMAARAQARTKAEALAADLNAAYQREDASPKNGKAA